jgi:AcrR family transcriptional regulator
MTPTVPTSARPSPRQRILEAAHDLFYSQGIRATGVDRVIEVAKVTKVTFYRQFPSKDDLVAAYLEYRHDLWMGWFRTRLEVHRSRRRSGLDALLRTLREWWDDPSFRGCAFINAATEIGPSSPAALETFRRHKSEMLEVLGGVLPLPDTRRESLQAIAFAVDGAILHAQAGAPLDRVETALRGILGSWLGIATPPR